MFIRCVHLLIMIRNCRGFIGIGCMDGFVAEVRRVCEDENIRSLKEWR